MMMMLAIKTSRTDVDHTSEDDHCDYPDDHDYYNDHDVILCCGYFILRLKEAFTQTQLIAAFHRKHLVISLKNLCFSSSGNFCGNQ